MIKETIKGNKFSIEEDRRRNGLDWFVTPMYSKYTDDGVVVNGYTIPSRSTTNGGNIPKFIQALAKFLPERIGGWFDPIGPALEAFVAHDERLRMQRIVEEPRTIIDMKFYYDLLWTEMPKWLASLFYLGVRGYALVKRRK